ncbi:hypothetical protein C8D95_10619 [Silicimonas algicola]|uniref:Uncharacterized protein n=1 Tax=Silicimonas algicola TaxID=1826607 RepID=A0A316G3W0_9RHOB|nr:hypothetical protein C8D95_10619 [Silicimonas algicola]
MNQRPFSQTDEFRTQTATEAESADLVKRLNALGPDVVRAKLAASYFKPVSIVETETGGRVVSASPAFVERWLVAHDAHARRRSRTNDRLTWLAAAAAIVGAVASVLGLEL